MIRTIFYGLLYWPILLLFALYAMATNSLGWSEIGFNYRATSGYVTDGANETYVTGDAFPTTRSSVTFGWTSTLSDAPRNRDNTVDRRLAGVHRIANSSPKEFRVTLPSTGDWTICIALGDALFSSPLQYVEVFDDTVSKFAINDTDGTAGGNFDDAMGTNHTAANWPSSNVCRTVTFASTAFYMQVGANSGSGDTYIAHLRIYSGGGTTTTTTTTLPADYFCGVDTNRDGSVPNPCPEPDKDADGYPSSASYTGPYGSAVDCDDNDFFIYTGIETTAGCSAGQYKTCQADGTYTSCSNVSAFTCHTGSGQTYWIGPSGGTSAAGTYADPWNWFCFSDSSLACYHAPVAGDCFVFKSGSYSGTWSSGTKQIYVQNRDGTASDRITMREEPGTRPKLNGAGSAPSAVFTVHLEDSNYWAVRGFEIDGTGDYSQTAIHFAGGHSPIVHNNYIHDTDGADDNLSAIHFRAGTINATAHHNLTIDNYQRAEPTDQNSGAITVMDDFGNVTLWNNIVANSIPVGYGIRMKHPDDNCVPSIKYNFVNNVWQYGIQSADHESSVTNNWIQDCEAYALLNGNLGDVDAWHKDAVFSYNTVQRCALINVSAPWSETVHQAYDGTTIFTAAYNIMEDDNMSYDLDAGDGVTRFCEYNCTSGEFAAAAGKAIWSNNVYWSTGTSTLRFGYFGQAGGGANYGSLTAWQTAGFDAGSVQSNPNLDADGISATYPNHGWRANMFTNVSGTTTTTTSTTTTSSTTTTTTLPPSSYNAFVPALY